MRPVSACVLLLVAVVASTTAEAVPSLITYQGALTDASGNPANGTFSLTFGMYANPTGGAALWTQTVSGVKVTDGVFTVILGGGTAFPAGLVNCNYLQVSVGGTALLPRHQLTSVPFAIDSQNLAGAAASTYRDAENLTSGYLPMARIAAGAITGGKIKNGTIDTVDLADDAVDSAKLAPGAVYRTHLNNNVIGSAEIVDGQVRTNDLDNGAVTGAKIAAGTWIEGDRPDQSLGVKSTSTQDLAAALRVWAAGTSGQVNGIVAQTDAAGGGSAGVEGRAGATSGVHYGVVGSTVSNNPNAAGVYGEGGSGAIGVLGASSYGGVLIGGVVGQSDSTYGGNGVLGIGAATTGENTGVRGVTNSPTGHALHAYCANTGAYGLYVETGKSYFWGPVKMDDKLEVWGYATFAGGHGDLAENYRADTVEAGDVVIIGPDGKLAKCTEERDSRVAGVVSTQPSMKLNGRLDDGEGVAPLALVGRVLCKVDATKAPIQPGDLLVSSSTPGHAMKCTSKRPAAGTVIGKALEPLASGTGTIQVLVTLR